MLQSDKNAAVGHIPSGLFIVTAADNNNSILDGYLASFVQQVSFNPLVIALAVKPGRPAYDLIKAGKVFTVNVVGDHDKTYLKHFWKGYDPKENPLKDLPHHMSELNGFILDQAKSAIECVMIGSAQPGDHEVIFAEVKASHVMSIESKPMVHIRKSGADY
jgi:flavin reductase (DIM6/NTAB) family NADH-FMN oxidoreductase RutF